MPTPPPAFRLIGRRAEPFRDGYHAFLMLSWPKALGAIAGVWLLLNALFATAYWVSGGIQNARPGDWRDCFYFSVQTMGTIGYGAMSPATDLANVIVVVESVVGLVVTAVATGLVFSKFGRTTSRVVFAQRVVIGLHDGQASVTVRLGNERLNRIVDVRYKLSLVRTERTAEGQTFYRFHDLPLVRAHGDALMSTFHILHRITPESALHGYDAARMTADEAELHVVVTGLDETTLQPVYATHNYTEEQIAWNARYVDMLAETPEGTIEVDLRRFHDVVVLGG